SLKRKRWDLLRLRFRLVSEPSLTRCGSMLGESRTLTDTLDSGDPDQLPFRLIEIDHDRLRGLGHVDVPGKVPSAQTHEGPGREVCRHWPDITADASRRSVFQVSGNLLPATLRPFGPFQLDPIWRQISIGGFPAEDHGVAPARIQLGLVQLELRGRGI